MKLLLLNAGSSSLKCTLIDSSTSEVLASSLADWAGSATIYHYSGPTGEDRHKEVSWKGHAEAVRRVIQDIVRGGDSAASDRSDIAAVGHRIVHGGQFTSSVRITPEVRSRITALADLAPLHNPPSLETLAAAEAALPSVPHVAVFDTAFHSTIPPEASLYPIPRAWTDDWGIRRFGFHGLSHAYCSRRAAELLKRPLKELRLVICHLGHGCSATAVVGGRSVDTTMGFTPLEGLMMGTRCGSIDPSIVLHVQEHHGLTVTQVESALNHESGLLGVSGQSADMRSVLKSANEGNVNARTALAIYSRRVRQAIGALTVTMGGIDALVFTAGVGENAKSVRKDICAGLQCLGLELDTGANDNCKPDADIANRNSPNRILVIKTREDLTMLQEVLQVLGE